MVGRLSFGFALTMLLFGCDARERQFGADCSCAGEVPEGVLNIACGETQCVNGAGYRCTGNSTAEPAPEACTMDGGVPDGAEDVAMDGGGGVDVALPDVGPAGPRFQTFIEDSRLEEVHDVWIGGPTNVWFATSSGQVVRWDGSESPDAWNFGFPLHSIYGTSPTEVWVVGDDGFVANFDGDSSFEPLRETPFDYYPARDTWGNAEARYIAGNSYGRIEVAEHSPYDRYGSFRDSFDGPDGDTRCVAGSALGIWAGAEDGMWGYDGEWHHILDDEPIAVTPVTANLAVFIQPTVATLVNFREVALSGGFGPHSLSIPPGIESGRPGPKLTAVWADSRELWVVGTEGYAAVMTNITVPTSGFRRVDTGTTSDLHSVFGDSGQIFLGGEGIILRSER